MNDIIKILLCFAQLLICINIQGQRKYFDAKAFDLKGHVKEVTIVEFEIDRSLCSDPILELFDEKTYKFNYDGSLIGLYKSNKFYYDGIDIYKSDNPEVINYDGKEITNMQRDSKGNLIKYRCGDLSYICEYDNKSGLLLKEIINSDEKIFNYDSNGISKSIYNYYLFDSLDKCFKDTISDKFIVEDIDNKGNWISRIQYTEISSRLIIEEKHIREITYYPEKNISNGVSNNVGLPNNKDFNHIIDNKATLNSNSVIYLPYSDISKNDKDNNIQGFKLNGKTAEYGEYSIQQLMLLLSGWTAYDTPEEALEFFQKNDIACEGYINKKEFGTIRSCIIPNIRLKLLETFSVEKGDATLGSKKGFIYFWYSKNEDGSDAKVTSSINLYPCMAKGIAPDYNWSKKNLNKVLKNFYRYVMSQLKSEGYDVQKYNKDGYSVSTNPFNYIFSIDLSSLAWNWSNINIKAERKL